MVSGNLLARFTASLVDAFNKNVPLEILEIPADFTKFRSALGEQIYGPSGYYIPREDKVAFQETQIQNFCFYNAPAVAVAIDRSLSAADILSVGIYIQTQVLQEFVRKGASATPPGQICLFVAADNHVIHRAERTTCCTESDPRLPQN
jgi:hypothetical protein